jgi:hypothetical protein
MYGEESRVASRRGRVPARCEKRSNANRAGPHRTGHYRDRRVPPHGDAPKRVVPRPRRKLRELVSENINRREVHFADRANEKLVRNARLLTSHQSPLTDPPVLLPPPFLVVEQIAHCLNIGAIRNTQLLFPTLQRRCRKIIPAKLRTEVIPNQNIAFV